MRNTSFNTGDVIISKITGMPAIITAIRFYGLHCLDKNGGAFLINSWNIGKWDLVNSIKTWLEVFEK